MRITRLEPILIAVPYRYGGPAPEGAGAWRTMDTLLVRVETEDGLVGWGEAFGFGACTTTRAALASLVAPLALGRAGDDIAGLMDDLQRRLHHYGRTGPVAYALSGLDIALWDIAGKRAGVPVHRLLGSTGVPERIPAYASLLRYGDPALAAENAAAAAARGYRHIKLHEIGWDEIAAARAAVGGEIALMVDANCAWPLEEAMAMAARLAPLDLDWLEEPLWPPEDFASLARLRRAGGVRLAVGENAGTEDDFARLIAHATVDYLQPSVTKIGGISGMRKIIALARRHGVAVAPHSPYFGPGLIATLHLIAAELPGQVCERFYCALEASPLGAAVDAPDGRMPLPSAPGLGLEVDERVIARYRVD